MLLSVRSFVLACELSLRICTSATKTNFSTWVHNERRSEFETEQFALILIIYLMYLERATALQRMYIIQWIMQPDLLFRLQHNTTMQNVLQSNFCFTEQKWIIRRCDIFYFYLIKAKKKSILNEAMLSSQNCNILHTKAYPSAISSAHALRHNFPSWLRALMLIICTDPEPVYGVGI